MDKFFPESGFKLVRLQTADNTNMETIEPKINVNCDCCENSDYAEKSELEKIGWHIEPNLELCPVCNF